MPIIQKKVIQVVQSNFNPKQWQFLKNTLEKDIYTHLLVGGGGSGKTHALVKLGEELTVPIPEAGIAVVRNTAKDLMNTTYEEFITSIQPELIWNERKADKTIEVVSAEGAISSIEFNGLDDRNRWGGRKYTAILIDEANEIDLKDFLYLKTRLRKALNQKLDYSHSPYCFLRPRRPGEGLISYRKDGLLWDCLRFIAMILNPPDQHDHWLRKLWLDGEVAGTKEPRTVVTTSTYDNINNLPPSYIQIMEALPEAERQRMLDGTDSVGIVGDPVVQGFDETIHTFDGPLPKSPLICWRGMDPGWGHPTLYFGEVVDNTIKIWYECYGTKLFVDDFITKMVKPVEALLHEDTEYKDFIDHQHANQHNDKSRETTRSQLRKSFGYNFRSSWSSPDLRGELFTKLCREKRILIHKKYCPIIIKALKGSWYRDEHGDPAKDGYYDHAADGCGYLIWGAFGKKGYRGKNLASKEQERDDGNIDDLINKRRSLEGRDKLRNFRR